MRVLMAQLLEPRRDRISRVFDQVLAIIDNAFQARRTLVVKGAVVDAGPDHYARLEAGKLVVRLLCHAR
jgi:hypothetical protein